MTHHTITIAAGDGIGPEIMTAVRGILEAAKCPLIYEEVEVGEKAYLAGHSSGITPQAWDIVRKNPVLLKGPITTPQGSGYKSLNVTLRKTLGLFANVRPCRTYAPFVATQHAGMDVVVVRENEEDLYAGIEHRQTVDVFQCLKIITIPGTEKIIRYAFDYARNNGRKKITCLVKDNIMKLTDGLFADTFRRLGEEYPELEKNVQIIDIGTARVAVNPKQYDVIVTLNLYGDIISDVTAELTGSVGLAGSANVGERISMFEAIHGSAPDLAGKDMANPTALLQSAVMMLVHLGLSAHAETIQNALLCTLEDGLHTGDIFREGVSTQRVGTRAFGAAIIERLGRAPQTLPIVKFSSATAKTQPYVRPSVKRELCGVDLFICEENSDPELLASKLNAASAGTLKLKLMTNRGVKVWPDGFPETFCTDHWRCRFVHTEMTPSAQPPVYPILDGAVIPRLMKQLHDAGIDVVKTENLYLFDGQRGFSLGQGE
ncbi:MAG: NADP-dependent isocitrate dehydrogenase [Verrucomicrobia bacterium]|nr:MAG: NADP-dependent isocitrate dehydrogenase [Verrucomicrobiota bacterium]